jgi:hypothetical protein
MVLSWKLSDHVVMHVGHQEEVVLRIYIHGKTDLLDCLVGRLLLAGAEVHLMGLAVLE